MAGIGSTSGTANQNIQNIDLERGDGVPAHEPAAEQGATNDSAAKHDATNESTAKQDTTSKDAWDSISERVWKYEEDRIKGWNKQIDTLLVFAGLFSTVLTAFNVQYYVTLQPPSGTQVVLRLPADLRSPIQVTTLSSTPNPAVAATTVVINTLWFLALVLSLSAASVGITVKQWLSSYIPPRTMTSKQRTRLWDHRQRGLREWRVPAIVSVLPNLLQVALLLFLIGLVVLLWTLNRVSAIVVMVPVAILITLLGITSIIPTFVPECPYKSPQAWWIHFIIHHVTRLVALWPDPIARDWLDRDNNWLRARSIDRETDGPAVETVNMIVAADNVVRDDVFLRDVIVPASGALATALYWQENSSCLRAFYGLVQLRTEHSHQWQRVNLTCSPDNMNVAPTSVFRHDMDSGLVEAMAEATLRMLKGLVKQPWDRKYLAQEMQEVLSILQALLAVLRVQNSQSESRVLIELINWCCDGIITYGPNNAREKDPVEVIIWAAAQHAVRYQSKIKAITVPQQAILGRQAVTRLEQLLKDASFDSHTPLNDLLGLIGDILDNRQQPGAQALEFGDVVTQSCRLLGAKPIRSESGPRNTLISHIARTVKLGSFRSVECIHHLVICLHRIMQEPDDFYPEFATNLLSAIASLLDRLQPDDMMGELDQPLFPTLLDAVDLTGRVGKYRAFSYLEGIVAIYEAMMRKRPHNLFEADLEKLEAHFEVYTLAEGYYGGLVEEFKAKLSSMRQLIAAKTSRSDPSTSSAGVDALPVGH